MAIETIFNQTDPQYSNLWEFAIIPSVSLNASSFKNLGAGSLVQTNRLRFLAQSCTLPFMSLDTEKRNTGATHFTGFTPASSFDVEFLETSSFTVLDFFENWQDSIYDRNRRVWRKGNNRALGIIFLLQPIFSTPASEISNFIPDNPITSGLNRLRQEVSQNIPSALNKAANAVNYRPVRTYLVEGLVPTNINPISLDYNSPEQMRISVSFDFNQVVKPGDKVRGLLSDTLSGVTDFGENVLEGFPEALKSGGNALKGFWEG